MKIKITSIMLFLSMFGFSQKNVFDVARTGTIEEIKALHDENANVVNEVNESGYSPLILATYRSNNAVANYLIEVVEDIDYTCSLGSALMAATYKANTEIVENLLKKGANPNIVDSNGQTALMLAIIIQNTDLIKLLLAAKSDLTIRDNKNKQALDHALQSNDQTIIKLLTKN